ncbi:MAG: hypothetical protein FWB71_01395 [Defluviitaleaceae bacterium]|nr:hypothetical protein [Defluviitaleaceae bacterium]
MNLEIVKEVLMGLDAFAGVDIGLYQIQRNQEMSVSLFAGGNEARACIGGADAAGHEHMSVSLVLRWGRCGAAAFAKADEIYRAIANTPIEHGGRWGYLLNLSTKQKWIGIDERGIHEYVVDFDIFLLRGGN